MNISTQSYIRTGIRNVFETARDMCLDERPTRKLTDIIDKEFPDVDSIIDILTEWYDPKDIIQCFDEDDLIRYVGTDTIVDAARDTIEWDNALDEAVDERIQQDGLVYREEVEADILNEVKNESYKNMTPDELWEVMCEILDCSPCDIKEINQRMEELKDKMNESSYAYDIFKKTK